MDLLNAYRCQDGSYLVAPSCMQASFHERHAYGPLLRLGVVDMTSCAPVLRESIKVQIEQRLFALIEKAEFEACQPRVVEAG